MYHSEGVNISEVLLFRLLCEMPGHLQEELLPLIRLPLIRPADILKFVLPSKLVEKDELIRVLAFKADPTDVDLPTRLSGPSKFPNLGQYWVRRLRRFW